MTVEKLLPRALRRSSSAEGSSLTTFSGRGEIGEGSLCFDELGGPCGLESSAKYRIWERILHCRHVDVRIEGRWYRRRDRETAEATIGSKKSLGAILTKGFMATLDSPRADRGRGGGVVCELTVVLC